MKSKIVRIGKDAVSDKDPILVLFGDNATQAIENVSVLQSFSEKTADFELVVNDTILFGDVSYQVEHVGKNVNANLHSLGHITLIFEAFNSEHFLESSVYLSPYHLPTLSEGMTIEYLSN